MLKGGFVTKKGHYYNFVLFLFMTSYLFYLKIGQSVYFNAAQHNIPLSTFPTDFNSPVVNPNEITFSPVDEKPGSSAYAGVYNTSFLLPEGVTPNYPSETAGNDAAPPPSYALSQI